MMFVYFGILKFGTNSQKIKLFEELIAFYNLTKYITYAALCASMTRSFNSKIGRPMNMKVTLLMREYSKEIEPSELTEEIETKIKESIPIRTLLNTNSEDNTEFIYFLNEYKCNICNETTSFTQDGSFKLPLTEDKYICPKCSKQFNLQITVQITEDIIETINLKTPKQLYQIINSNFMTINKYEIDIDTFKQKHNDIFWNLIFFFDLEKISFDFLIPYGKKNGNPKNENDNFNYFSNLVISPNILSYEYENETVDCLIIPLKRKGSQIIEQKNNNHSSHLQLSSDNDNLFSFDKKLIMKRSLSEDIFRNKINLI